MDSWKGKIPYVELKVPKGRKMPSLPNQAAHGGLSSF